MIRKSGHRFSEKIMLKQRDENMMRFTAIASCSQGPELGLTRMLDPRNSLTRVHSRDHVPGCLDLAMRLTHVPRELTDAN
jgi:hypothetical protein